VAIVCVGLAFGAYFVLRYLGLWSENDTAVFSRVITGLQRAGGFDYPGRYVHGYAYPVWGAGLSDLTGLPAAKLLQLYTPLLGNLLLGVFGFAAFRKLLGSTRLGLLAATLMFLVPELVFTVSRGNHEKLTVSLTLFALLSLLNSFLEASREDRRWGVFAAWVAVYYLAAFTLVTINALFGSSFIVAATLTMAFAFAALRRAPQSAGQLGYVVQRLTLISGVSWLLVALVMFFVYPSAGRDLGLLRTTIDRLSALFLSFSPESNPFSAAPDAWASLGVYRLVSSFRWFLFGASFVTWLWLLRRAWRDLGAVPLARLFMLALYVGFGVQLALSGVVDLLGLAAGTNLQVRLYTYFALLAAPVLAHGLWAFTQRFRTSRGRTLLSGALGALLIGFTLLSLLKATLDPSVSNRWWFYRPAEVEAIHFWDARQQYGSLWVGVAGRLRNAYAVSYPAGSANHNAFDILGVDPQTADALRSPVIEAAAVAWRVPPPGLWLGDRTYDDGDTQIFHRIPQTPFQH